MEVHPENVVYLDMSDEEDGDELGSEMVAITRRSWAAASPSTAPASVTVSAPSGGVQQQLQIQASKRKMMPPLQELYSMKLPSQVVGPALKAMESAPTSKAGIPLTPHTTITAVKTAIAKPTQASQPKPAGPPPLRSVSSKPVDQLQVQVFGRRRKIMNIPQRKRLKNFRRDVGGADGFHGSSSKAAALEDDGWEEMENNSDDGGECEDSTPGGNSSLSPNSKKKPGPKGPRLKETPSGKFLFKLLEEHGVYDESGNKLYQCEICSSLYIKSFSLKRHYLRTHINYQFLTEQDMLNCNIPRDNDETNNPRGEIVDGVLKGVYKCHVCFDLFDTVPDLKDHLKTHASDVQAKNSMVKKSEPAPPPPPSSTPTSTATKEIPPVITIRKFTPETQFLPPPPQASPRFPPAVSVFGAGAPPGMIFPPGISVFPRGGPAAGTPFPNLTPLHMMPSPAAAAAAAMIGSPVGPFFVPQHGGTPPGVNIAALNAMRFMSPGGVDHPRFPPGPPNVQISPAIPPGFMANFPPNVSCVPSPVPTSMAQTKQERRSSTPITTRPSPVPANIPVKHGTSGGTLKIHHGAAAQKKMPALLSAGPGIEGGKTFPCEECGKVFPNQVSLQRHCDTAHGLFECKTCGMEFSQQEDLLTHVRTAHEERPPSTGRLSMSRGGKRAEEPEEDREPGGSREKIHIPGLDSELSLSAEVSITRVLKPGSQAAQQQLQQKAVSSVLQQKTVKTQSLIPPQPCISISKITRVTGGVASAVHADSKTSAHLQALRASPEIIVSPIPAGGSKERNAAPSKLAVQRASPAGQVKKNPEFQYTCLACGAAFSAYKEMVVHQEKVHGNPNVTVFRNRQQGTNSTAKPGASKSPSVRTAPPLRPVLSGTTITPTGSGVKPSTSEIVAEIRKEMQNNAARNAAVVAAAAAAVHNVSGIQITSIKRGVPKKEPASPASAKSATNKPSNSEQTEEMADLGIAALFASTSVGGSSNANAAPAPKKPETPKKSEAGKKSSQAASLPGPSTSRAARSPSPPPEEPPAPAGPLKAFDERLIDGTDQDYYTRVSDNVADNLQNHVEGRVNSKRKSRKVVPYSSLSTQSAAPRASSVNSKKVEKPKPKPQGFKFDPAAFKDEPEPTPGNTEEDFFKALGLRRVEKKPEPEPAFEETQRETYKSGKPDKWTTFAGELTRPKVFLCSLCGVQTAQLQQMVDHKQSAHPRSKNVEHLQWDSLERIPDELLPQVPKRQGVFGSADLPDLVLEPGKPTCTGCGWVGETVEELHVHIVQCAEDNGTSSAIPLPKGALKDQPTSFSTSKKFSSRGIARDSPSSPVKLPNVRVIKAVEPYPAGYVATKKARSMMLTPSLTRKLNSAGPSGFKQSKAKSPAKTPASPASKCQPSTSAQALRASSAERVRQPSPQPGPSSAADASSNGGGGGLKFIIRHGKIFSSAEAPKETAATPSSLNELGPSCDVTPPLAVKQEVIIQKKILHLKKREESSGEPQQPAEIEELPVETAAVVEEVAEETAEELPTPDLTIKSKKKKKKVHLTVSAEASEESDSGVSKASTDDTAPTALKKRKSALTAVGNPAKKPKLEVQTAQEEPQETEFVCQGCGVIFPNKSATDRHSRKCSRVTKMPVVEKAEPESELEDEDYLCPYCPEKFQDMEQSLEHAEACAENPKNVVVDKTANFTEPESEVDVNVGESAADTTVEETPVEEPEAADDSALMKPPTAPPTRVAKKKRRRVSQWTRGILGPSKKKKKKAIVAAAMEIVAAFKEKPAEEPESTPAEEIPVVEEKVEVAAPEPVIAPVLEDKLKPSQAPARKSSRISNKKAEQEKEKLETALKLAGEEGSCPTCGQVATAPGWMARHRNVCEGPPVVSPEPAPDSEEELGAVSEGPATPGVRPSRKRGSVASVLEFTPEPSPKGSLRTESNVELPSVQEVVEAYQLNDVDVSYTEKEYAAFKEYSLFQKHIRPLLMRANPKTAVQKIMTLAAAKYRDFQTKAAEFERNPVCAEKEECSAPEEAKKLPESPTVQEVLVFFSLNDVDVRFSEKEEKTVTDFASFQKLVRPVVSKANPKKAAVKISALVEAKYREYLESAAKEEPETPTKEEEAEAAPEEPEKLDEGPSVGEVLVFFALKDVDVDYSEMDSQALSDFVSYQKHVRPLVAKANPKAAVQKIMVLVKAKYREFLKSSPVEEEKTISAESEVNPVPDEVTNEVSPMKKKAVKKASPTKSPPALRPGNPYPPGTCMVCRRQMTHAHNLSRHYRTIHGFQKPPTLDEALKCRAELGLESEEDTLQEESFANASSSSIEEPPTKKQKLNTPKASPTVTAKKKPSNGIMDEKPADLCSPTVSKPKKKKKVSVEAPAPVPPAPVNEPAKTTLSVTKKMVTINDSQEKDPGESKTQPTTMITLQIHRKPKVAPPPSPNMEVQPGEKSAIISRKKSITLESGQSSRGSSVEPSMDPTATQILAVTRIKKPTPKSEEPPKPTPENASFVCQKCLRFFKQEVLLKNHQCDNENDDGDDDSNGGSKSEEAPKKARRSDKASAKKNSSNSGAAAEKNAKTASTEKAPEDEDMEVEKDAEEGVENIEEAFEVPEVDAEVIKDELMVADSDGELPPSEFSEESAEGGPLENLTCHVCGINFTCRGWFNQHVQRCHSVNSTAEELATLVAPGETLVVIDEINCCDLCGDEFSCASKFELHRQSCVGSGEDGHTSDVDKKLIELQAIATGVRGFPEGWRVVDEDEILVADENDVITEEKVIYGGRDVGSPQKDLVTVCPACGMDLKTHHEGLVHGLCHLIVSKTVSEFGDEESLFNFYCKCGADKGEILTKIMRYFDAFVKTEALVGQEVTVFRDYINSRPLEDIQVHFVHLEHRAASPASSDDQDGRFLDEDDDDLDFVVLDSSFSSPDGQGASAGSLVCTAALQSTEEARTVSDGQNELLVTAEDGCAQGVEVQDISEAEVLQMGLLNVDSKKALAGEVSGAVSALPTAEKEEDGSSVVSPSETAILSLDSTLGAVIETMQLMNTTALESDSLREIQEAMGATDEEMAMIQRLGESIGTNFNVSSFVDEGSGNECFDPQVAEFYSPAETLLDLDSNRMNCLSPNGSTEAASGGVAVGSVVPIAPRPVVRLKKGGLEALKAGLRSGKTFGCPKCSKTFPRQISLSLHLVQAHLGRNLTSTPVSIDANPDELTASKENIGDAKRVFRRKMGAAFGGLVRKPENAPKQGKFDLMKILLDEVAASPSLASKLGGKIHLVLTEADLTSGKHSFVCRYCAHISTKVDVLQFHLRHIHRVSEEAVEAAVKEAIIKALIGKAEKEDAVRETKESTEKPRDGAVADGAHRCKWCATSYETARLLNLHITSAHQKELQTQELKNEDIFGMTENTVATPKAKTLAKEIVQCPICDEHCAGYQIVRHVKSSHSDWKVEDFVQDENKSLKLTKMLGKQLITLEVTTNADRKDTDGENGESEGGTRILPVKIEAVVESTDASQTRNSAGFRASHGQGLSKEPLEQAAYVAPSPPSPSPGSTPVAAAIPGRGSPPQAATPEAVKADQEKAMALEAIAALTFKPVKIQNNAEVALKGKPKPASGVKTRRGRAPLATNNNRLAGKAERSRSATSDSAKEIVSSDERPKKRRLATAVEK